MIRMRRLRLLLAGVGVGLIMTSGCQTWVPQAGITMPSPDYLRHQPQYIPPSPPYPLPRELSNLEEAAAQQPTIPPRPLGP
jgi:hypothetical protein